MNLEIIIPSDEPVRLLSAVTEKLDYSRLTATYSRLGRIEYSPRLLFKIVLYGCSHGIYTTREIERACRENVNFMYLLEGKPAPDHNTIARFRREHLPYTVEDLLNQMAKLLAAPGTGISAPTQITVQELKKLRKRLYARKLANNVTFVQGKGRHKFGLQKAIESINSWLERLKRYNQDIHICGDRNSYSKTDPGATFTHVKEDHMKNGQLKPGYNVNVATVSEYIIGNYISADRTDTKSFIPSLEKNHKYKNDIGRRENMAYDAEKDEYTCAQGQKLQSVAVKRRKSKTGSMAQDVIVYECAGCKDCPVKEKCIWQKKTDKTPLEERVKRLNVSKYFIRQREAMK